MAQQKQTPVITRNIPSGVWVTQLEVVAPGRLTKPNYT